MSVFHLFYIYINIDLFLTEIFVHIKQHRVSFFMIKFYMAYEIHALFRVLIDI